MILCFCRLLSLNFFSLILGRDTKMNLKTHYLCIFKTDLTIISKQNYLPIETISFELMYNKWPLNNDYLSITVTIFHSFWLVWHCKQVCIFVISFKSYFSVLLCFFSCDKKINCQVTTFFRNLYTFNTYCITSGVNPIKNYSF